MHQLRRLFDLYQYEGPDLEELGTAVASAARFLQAKPPRPGASDDELATRRFLLARIAHDGDEVERLGVAVVRHDADEADHVDDKPVVRPFRDALRSGFTDFLELVRIEAKPSNASKLLPLAQELESSLKSRAKDIQRAKAREMKARIRDILDLVAEEPFSKLLDDPKIANRVVGLQGELAALGDAIKLGEHGEAPERDDARKRGQALVEEIVGDCIAVSRGDEEARQRLLGVVADLEDRLAAEHKGQGGRPKASAATTDKPATDDKPASTTEKPAAAAAGKADTTTADKPATPPADKPADKPATSPAPKPTSPIVT